ncbi:MAG TPA: PQQ-binding-like beta-propeller repeat protein [Steroidobacteraceae bacterium]|jgi:alcohol dehydrogenase (cytochrome c)|nr:PQQ-binding-like beta-propeller repeat protein [Steroidobacteraceae bacterium]
MGLRIIRHALLPGLMVLLCQAAHGVPPDVSSPSFTASQAAAGRLVYARACGLCHGAALQGAAAVALVGPAFARTWGDGRHQAADLFAAIAIQMPKNAPGSVSPTDNLALAAFILQSNGYASGAAPLTLAAFAGALPAAPGYALAASAPPGLAAAPLSFPQAPRSVLPPSGTGPQDAQLLRVADADWLTFNRDLAGERFSPLAQINTGNAQHLQVRCIAQLGEMGSFETSPIVHDGQMFVTTAHKVLALDGATCAVKWSYNYVPVDPEHLPGNRGVALYEGRVFRGTTDGHLICLDAASGKLLWDARVADGALGYEITGAPVAFAGKVFTGDAGADTGIRGRIYAFDATDGALVWAFDIVPHQGEAGAASWSGGTDKGGGATWSSMAIDPQRQLLFVPTGNPAPDFNDANRAGDNLYTDSVVALDLATGKLAWYVQQVAHDMHDWDTAAAPALYAHGGRRLMAVASKNGLLYQYDLDTHQVLSQAPFTTRSNVDALPSAAGVHVCPGALGQYNGPAFSPLSGRVFVATADRCNVLTRAEPHYVPGGVYFGGMFRMDPPALQSGWIKAFEAISGHELWSVHRHDPVLAAVTPTGGELLLTGDMGGSFLALDARNGRVLYEFNTGGPVAAGISVYAVAGREYIAVPSGSSSRDAATATAAATLIVFSLQ